MILGVLASPSPAFATEGGTTQCGTSNTFFSLKSWYHYLQCEKIEQNGKVRLEVSESNFSGKTINDDGTTTDNMVVTVMRIIFTVLGDLFFIAGTLAAVYIIYSGIMFITSAGDPAGNVCI